MIRTFYTFFSWVLHNIILFGVPNLDPLHIIRFGMEGMFIYKMPYFTSIIANQPKKRKQKRVHNNYRSMKEFNTDATCSIPWFHPCWQWYLIVAINPKSRVESWLGVRINSYKKKRTCYYRAYWTGCKPFLPRARHSPRPEENVARRRHSQVAVACGPACWWHRLSEF